MSTFQAPVRVSAPGTNADPGDVMVSQTGVVTYDSGTTYMFTIPKGAWIQEFYVDVPSVGPFNAGTTNIVHIGDLDAGGFNYFASITGVNISGRYKASDSAAAGQLDKWVDNDASRKVTATFSQSGAAATQGSAKITAVYTLASANLA